MKTANVPRAPTGAPGCCGPVKDRVQVIKQVSQGLRDGHMGIAQLYESLATDLTDPKEQKQFRDFAAKHRKMGDESLKVLLPDDLEDDNG